MLFKSPLRYSQSWEDHRVIEKGLEIKKGDVVVSILSSGDNFLNLLRFEPKIMYGFDINPAQFYEVKLKIKAIETLGYEDFIKLLGYTGKDEERVKIFGSLSDKLDPETCSFWGKYKAVIRGGIASQGSTEKKFSFERQVINFILGKYYYNFINSSDINERKKIFEKKIDKSYLRFFSKFFTNKTVSNLLYNKDLVKNLPSNFDYNKIFWEKNRRVWVDIGCKNNPYRSWFFTGNLPYDQQFWQPYLQEKNYTKIKNNLDKIKIFNKDLCSGLKDIDSNSVNAFYISDIFDWMNFDEMEKNLYEILRVAKNGAKIISFVIMYDKGIPKSLEKYFKYDENENKKLLEIDRVGFYPKICLWTVNK